MNSRSRPGTLTGALVPASSGRAVAESLKLSVLFVLAIAAACATGSADHPLPRSPLGALRPEDSKQLIALVREDNALRELTLLSTVYAPGATREVVLIFTSTGCEGRVRTQVRAIEGPGGWSLFAAERTLDGVIMRGPISCEEASEALRVYAEQPAALGGLGVPIPATPDAVGKAYSFVAADELGGNDEELFAVVFWTGPTQWLVLIKRGEIVDVRRKWIISTAGNSSSL